MKIKLVIGLILILTAALNPFLTAQPLPPTKEDNPPGGGPGGPREPAGEIIEQGTVEAESVSKVYVRWPKKYLHLLVEEGDFVRKGELLMEIEPAKLAKKIDGLELMVTAVEAEVTAMEKVTVPLKKLELQSARWEAKQIEEKARLEFRAQEKMFKEDLSSAQQLEEARSAFEVAKLRVKGIELQLTNFEEGPDQARIRALKAQLQAARNRRDDLDEIVGEEARKAPHAGKVISTSKEAKTPASLSGQGIQSQREESAPMIGELSFVAIAKVAEVIISAYIYQGDIGRIRIGGRVLSRADYAPGHAFPGRIVNISPSAISRGSTSVFLVKALVENQQDILKPGTTVEVTFLTRTEK